MLAAKTDKMVLGRPKRKKVRLVKNPSSNLVQAKILEPRNHALPTKALPFRPGSAQLQQSISHNHAQAVSGRDERSYAPKAQSYQRTAVRPNEESIGWNSSAGGPQSPDPPVCIGKPRKQSLDQRKEAPQDSFSRDPALCELISSRFNAIITSIDGENFSGDERELGEKFVFFEIFLADR